MLRLSLMFAAIVALSLSLDGTSSARGSDNSTAQFQKAYAAAQDAFPDGQLIKARSEKNGAIFGFYFMKDGKLTEIEVNATSLKVVKQVTQSDPTNKAGQVGQAGQVSVDVVKLIGQQKAGKTKLPEGRLLEIAADALKDTGISGIEYSIVDGKLVFKVGDLVLDAATGKPVAK
jgi:hypothetical protein